jgi:hypothetical protein
LSELVAVERSYGERVQGIMMEVMLKGQRKEHPKGSGRWVQWSPLVRGYRRLGDKGWEYRSRWEWETADGKGHTLKGKGFERFDAWVPSGHKQGLQEKLATQCDTCGDWHVSTKDWMQWLLKHDRELVESQIITPEPIFRRAGQVESWLRQVGHQEAKIAECSEMTDSLRTAFNGMDYIPLLDEHFPQHTRSCEWPSRCQFVPICHEGVSTVDPLASGSYVLRTPHHTPELVQLGLAPAASISDIASNLSQTESENEIDPRRIVVYGRESWSGSRPYPPGGDLRSEGGGGIKWSERCSGVDDFPDSD